MWIAEFVGFGVVSIATCAAGWGWSAQRLAASERERRALAKSSQVLEEERRVLELIARGASLHEVLDALTHAIERMTTDCLCTVMLLDDDRRRLLAGSGGSFPAPYMQAINRLEIGPEVGACGTAAFLNQTVIVEDIVTDPKFAAARDFVTSFGVRACWSVPIRDSNKEVIGTFAMYHNHPAQPQDWELRLVEAGAHLAGNAIERLHAEEKLRENAERISLAEKSAAFGIWDLEIASGTLTVSDGFAAIHGTAGGAARLSGEQAREIVHPDDWASLQAALRRAIVEGDLFRHEHRVMIKDAPCRWVRTQASTVSAADGQRRVSGVVIDITKEKEMVTRLEQACAEAEAATRGKSEFLANMSHEIRTPMNGIIGTISLMKDSFINDEQREHFDTIQRCGEFLLQLVDDILNLSKIEAGKLSLEQIPFSARALMVDAVAVIAPMVLAKDLKVFHKCDWDVPPAVIGDPLRLRQVLMNLLSNAVKFTETGSITVELSTRTRGDSAELHFTVRDTGIGISPEVRQSVFEPFMQADSSTTRRYGGTGLGLAISRGLIALMNGRLEMESEPGRGTCFHIFVTLPVTAQKVTKPQSSEGRILRTKRCLRILLAEDNGINQKVAVLLLEKMGHKVDVVADGRQAVMAVGRDIYDLVLMDCQMPVMDGYAATRAIRELGSSRRIPIIAMTANVMPEDRRRCMDSGMDDYIGKPVSIDQLQRAIEASNGTVDVGVPNVQGPAKPVISVCS